MPTLSPRGNMVPLRRYPMTANSTFIPADIPVRSVAGVKGFEKKQGTSRVRIGGANGASVTEKVVNITQTPIAADDPGNPNDDNITIDERVPVWTTDERFLYFAANTRKIPGLYKLWRISSAEPTDAGPNSPTPITNPADTTYDYYFPTVNLNQTRIAYVRSSDGKNVDDPTKKWDLYVSDMPANGTYVDTAVLGPTNLRELTAGRTFPTGVLGADGQPVRTGFASVGRPTWVGSTDLVFSARLQGDDPNYHLFTINIETRVIFQLTSGAANERNPSASPDGRIIAFDSNAVPSTTGGTYISFPGDGTRAPRSENNPTATPAGAPAAGDTYNIFTMGPLGQNITQFTLQYDGAPAVNSVQPAWSSTRQNNFTNIDGTTFYLAFSSDRIPTFATDDPTQSVVTGWAKGPKDKASIYYAIFSRDNGTTPLSEVEPTNLDNLDSDGARRLDTANDTLKGGVLHDQTAPRFNDQYPTFSPFITAFRVGFQSNRNGTYLKDGVGSDFTPTDFHNENNLFIGSLIDITAPTLIRFDTSSPTGEVVHINLVQPGAKNPYNPDLAASVRNQGDGILPGSTVHFAVRVEDRESGMRGDDSPDGGAVYLQIKNPNSRYQTMAQGGNFTDIHRGEHKEFVDFGSTLIIENNVPLSWSTGNYAVGQEYEAQAISAISTTDPAAGLNTDPNDASAVGSPYYSHRANTLGPGPLYIPSIDDALAFAGTTSLVPLDGGTYNVGGGSVTTPNVWLKLRALVKRDANGNPIMVNGHTVPERPADGKGGVLYGASWVTPSEASDWYIDVIVYDNAINPFDPTQRSNAIIYDNVWGFSTANDIAPTEKDVLFVADYTLGQKFFSSRFGPRPTGDLTQGANLQPIFFGSESYFCDIDMQHYPSELGILPPAPSSSTGVVVWDNDTPFELNLTTAPGDLFGYDTDFTPLNRSAIPNPLGVASYDDEATDNETVQIDGYRLPAVGHYNIWRVLSRGPVPATLLQEYQPAQTTSPADTAKGESSPRTIYVSNRVVVWSSPFTGDQFVGAGSLTDIQAQNNLTAYVQAGGRLFISGQDIGFALAGNGQNNFFFSNILKAQFLNDTGGSITSITPVNNTGANQYVNQLDQDPWNPANANHVYGAYVGGGGAPPYQYRPLNASAPGNNGTVRYSESFTVLNPNTEYTGDGSYDASGTAGYLDRIRPKPSTTPASAPANTPPDAVDVFVFPGSPAPPAFAGVGVAPTAGTQLTAIMASAVPAGFSPVGHTGYIAAASATPVGKVVYSAVGYETISQGWYDYTRTGEMFARRATLGRRAQLMHNIVCHFRTGVIQGKVIDNDGNPVNDALVRAIPEVTDDTLVASGTGLTDDTGTFSIVGLEPGWYVLFGYKAGYYTQHNLGNLVHGGSRATSQIALKKAGPGALKGIQNPSAQNPQGGVFAEDGVTPIAGVEIQVRRKEANGNYTQVLTLSSDGRNKVTLPDGTSILLPAGAYYFPALLISDYQVVANSIYHVVNGQIVEKPTKAVTDANGKTHLFHINDDGSLRLEQYGEVRIGVSPANEYRLGAGVQVIPDPNPAAPNPIGPTVRITENVTAQIDFLLPANPQRISGTVVDQDTNQPIKDAIITATLKSNGTLVAQATTDANGKYTLTKVNPAQNDPDPTLLPGGTYVITATANGYSTTVPPSAVNNVEVTVGGQVDPNITAPDIRLKKLPPGSVSGLVRRSIDGTRFSTVGVDGATVSFYAVQTVGGVQVQSPNVSYTATVQATPTSAPDGYTFNFSIASVLPGTYNAYVSKPGLTGDPSPFANIVVTTGTETRNINFTLEPPKIYGSGIQLISVPQDFSAVTSRDVFGIKQNADNNGDGVVNGQDNDIFNAFNVADWTGTQYNISPDIRLRLGKGYFVQFAATAAVATSGVATTTSSYKIDLSAGWNLIGNPFADQTNPSNPAGDIDISAPGLVTYSYVSAAGQQRVGVSLAQAVADNALQGVVYSYTGSNSGSTYIPGGLLKPWSGYWIRAFVPVQMILQYPGPATRALRANVQNGGVFKTISRAERDMNIPLPIVTKGITDWRLQLAARQGDLADTQNTIGNAPDATDAFDNKYDHEKPPMVSDVPTLYLSITGKTLGGRAAGLIDNITAPGSRTQSWDFTVKTTATGPVTVYWPNVARLPRGLEPVLVDVATGKRVPMRGGASSYTFTPNGRAEHAFRVEVAPPASMPLDILNLRTTSRDVSGSGNYRFSFMPTRSVDVNSEIQTVTGKTVKRFQSRATSGAETSIVWDGRDEAGQLLPPGPYVLNITARDDQGNSVSRRVPILKNR